MTLRQRRQSLLMLWLALTLAGGAFTLPAQNPPANPVATPAPAVPASPPVPVPAPDPALTRSFEAARKAFQDGNHSAASQFFGEFMQKFPQSELVADAALFQARSLLELGRLDDGFRLLESRLAASGRLADEFRYWMGEALFRKTDFKGAAEQFRLLLKEHPSSARRLEAAYSEARARFRLGDFRQVVELLRAPAGGFREAAKSRAADNLVALGELMLVESLLQLGDYPAAEEAGKQLGGRSLTPEMRWRREKLLCQVYLGAGRLAAALSQSSNAVAAAQSTGLAPASAEAIALQGSVLIRLNRMEDAAAAYSRNLGEGAPVPRQREALLELIQIHLARNDFASATQKLELFMSRNPGGAHADAALMTYGDIFLQAHVSAQQGGSGQGGPSSTNLLVEAITRFDQVIRLQPPSPLVGSAHLQRGWCLWGQGRFAESQESFRNAVQSLPLSEQQAVAQFKLGETQMRLQDYTNALVTFRSFTNRFLAFPRVQNSLMDQALLHLMRASFEVKDEDSAEEALERLLAWRPTSEFVDSSLLLMGQRLTLFDQPERARVWLSKVPDVSPRKPVAELALARTYTQQGMWSNALAGYSRWLDRFTNQSDLQPRAEFNLAWTSYQAGQETTAHQLFTNFVARYPTNTLTPLAEFWVGDYFLRRQSYTNAEIQFRRIYQNTNWPVGELTYEAKMQEGRAAFARQGFNNAQELFTQILNDKPPYPDLVSRAFFAYGDCLMMQASISTNAFARYVEASKAFRNITFLYATNDVAPKAWGSLGNCFLQLAQQEPTYYTDATNAYQQVLSHPLATLRDRSQAEVGLGIALRKLGDTFTADRDRLPILERAQYHLQRVLYERNLLDGETADRLWQKKAGLESAQISESRQDWKAAVGTYERLKQLVPQLAPDLDRRIARLKPSLPPEPG